MAEGIQGNQISVCDVSKFPLPPNNALKLGYQFDGAGDLWVAVANTKWGNIPGKAQNGTCWFPYGDEEHFTNDFGWVVSQRQVKLVKNEGYVPNSAIQCGYQTGSRSYLYAAIANTGLGHIPGKAQIRKGWFMYKGYAYNSSDFNWIEWGRIPGKPMGPTCWYSYDGKEYFTSDFDWIVLN